MKISSAIYELEKIREKFGDVDCWVQNFEGSINKLGDIKHDVREGENNLIYEWRHEGYPIFKGAFFEDDGI